MSGFNLTEIPTDWRVPGTYVQVRPNYSQAGLLPYPARALIVGQMLGTGAGIAGQVYPLLGPDQAANLFGYGSMAHRMAIRFLAANNSIPVDIVALADVGVAMATGTITVVRVPAASGAEIIEIAGQRVGVLFNAATDTSVTLAAAKIAAAINAQISLPVTATSVLGVVTLTARHAGVSGNDIQVRVPNWPDANAPSQFNATNTVMASGAVNPTVASIFAAIAAVDYTDIVMGWNDAANLAALNAELNRRYGAMVKLDGYGFVAPSAAYGSLPGIVSPLNGKYLSALGAQNWRSPPWEVAAAFGGAASQALYADPARQLRGLALPGIVPPGAADLFDPTERNLLLHDGISTFEVRADGTVAIERAISTYLTTDLGFADTAWLDINIAKVCSRIRYDWRAYVSAVWPSSKLTDDGSLAAESDPTIATPSRLKGSWIARSKLYEQSGWIENSAVLGASATFDRSKSDRNTVMSDLPIQIVGNLISLDCGLSFRV
jgi:phage tail sheath gpL-like